MHVSSTPSHTGFATSVATPPLIIADQPLMSPWESTGSFWMPESPQTIFWGKISFEAGLGVTITVEGKPVEEVQPGYLYNIPTIFGRLHNGALVSAFECRCVTESFLTDRQTFRTEITSGFSILGGHWKAPGECRLETLQIKLSHLNDWFKNPYKIDYEGVDYEKWVLSFNPDILSASFTFQGIEVSLNSFCSRSIPIWVQPSGKNWNYDYNLVVEPHSSQELPWMLTLASSIRNLFIFLVGSGVYTLDLLGKQASPCKGDGLVRIFRVVAVPRAMRVKSRYFSTTHEEYSGSIPQVITTWFERQHDFGVAFDTYRELLCTDGASRATFLLRTTQTLEHLYGIVWPDDSKYTSKPTFRRFVNWIRESFPKELVHVDSEEMLKLTTKMELLLSRIGGLNDISLRSKLERLFGEVPPQLLMPLFGNPQDQAGFLDPFLGRLEATRHFLTHFSEKQKEMAFKDEEIEEATLICWAILTYWISRNIGFDDVAAQKITLQARNAMFLVHSGVDL
jgi:hypothetical protein